MKKKKKKLKKKKRFASDNKIEYDREELIESNMANAKFLHPTGRDCLHIWREDPLACLGFEGMLNQPLSKDFFGKFRGNVFKHFSRCNLEENAVDDLLDNLLENEVERARDRDYGSDEAVHDEEENDIGNENENVEMEMDIDGMNGLSVSNLHQQMDDAPIPLVVDDDNASTLDSVCNDALPAPQDDALFAMDDDASLLAAPAADNHLSFDTNDENVLTQMNDDDDEEKEKEKEEENEEGNDNGIKP